MIAGVALGRLAPVVVAVRDGVLQRPVTDDDVTGRAASGGFRAASGGFQAASGGFRAACVAVDLTDADLAPVAVIRVGGPCPAALRPLAGRPEGAGVATIVRGGHSLTGRPLAALDTEAVRRFAAGCGLSDFAVTATGSPMLADHELAVASIVAAEVPGARITLSYEFGRPGLRAREENAIRNAALGPAAGRIADAAARELPGPPVYFARSGSGLVSAHYFRRYPLTCDRGGQASLARGRAALAGGLGPEASAAWDVPAGGLPDEVVMAYGAALGGPQAQVERIVQARGRAELDRALQDARDEVLTRVVSAGAAPGSARVAETTVNPLSFLPDGLYRVRVAAEGATP
ncbi:hypothetical protein HII36_48955 [Nonomuraea sp. NN258]|uniref:hypothetical protein n=1 Tax=Nonomuraea antri TaxID=2730852 RepID=UPI00156A26D7|nr:hypothetical protein [Nonomuraea antri]NRQ39709.1 hypothetical protein [Nonomuraea antri]